MRQRVCEKMWVGRAEHGFRGYDIEITGDSLTVTIAVKDYNDWKGAAQVVADYEKSKSFPLGPGPVTKDFVLKCIRSAGEALKETYLLPKTTDELSAPMWPDGSGE